MTSTALETLQRRIGRFPIELPAAALMAGAVALATIALPAWRFESAVVGSGLPSVVAAAQPPLGETARIVAAIALSLISFAIVWISLRALDRRPARTDFPAFRAADLHPDAPRRRPILAGAEFGLPSDTLPSIEEQLEGRKAPVVSEPLPSFLAPQPAEFGHSDPEPTAWSEEILELEDALPETDEVLAVETPIAEPEEAEIETQESSEEEESVGDLMARLENGLVRRGSRPVFPAGGVNQKDELRRALGDLNRIAGRGR